MALAAIKRKGTGRVKDVKLVSLFLNYLSEKDEVTASEAVEFRRFQEILDGVTFAEPAWQSDSDAISTCNQLFLPDKVGSQQDIPTCHGACCCSAATEQCLTWYPKLAFI